MTFISEIEWEYLLKNATFSYSSNYQLDCSWQKHFFFSIFQDKEFFDENHFRAKTWESFPRYFLQHKPKRLDACNSINRVTIFQSGKFDNRRKNERKTKTLINEKIRWDFELRNCWNSCAINRWIDEVKWESSMNKYWSGFEQEEIRKVAFSSDQQGPDVIICSFVFFNRRELIKV